ncbi:triphosphoribosyl-dephospho-CoA synthase CitG [Enterococcus ureilyticus]|uniref:Probable 2-(5''-triphosphoribosyl)-3'-dephosphocoenzyme-A synthase n=1 Tax=Enterococcus ureilyticus TaxID=1131292 RepID=A0A1E5HG91_9ENTE|nr:triphosphoribosyl-dephospho-CoA synthase CitG [Enterococcus ureilyticus]MBM7687946.1 triphosphoribosyl-dephospho-CoA synthase [Enterococcus ureilyticus]MBO0445804.1 triphosphoribosyl-dephospho-CoA synthase CitG [Enterococcus ureilyticus]OEG23972.1 triphosphoribosyl-dephospho-CoA synthase CitG [Enterococcus ureilyticus]
MKQLTKKTNPQLIGEFALQALLYEATLSPKPGLVDPVSCGAHKDMNYLTFIDSSIALAPFFTEYVQLGFTHEGTLVDLFEKVRMLGQQAEKMMLIKTKGINTHKGANFSFALLLSATGKMMQEHQLTVPFSEQNTTDILAYVKHMTTGLLAKDFADLTNKKQLSYGEKLYLDYGITGIRGEAEAGYPSLKTIALPFLRQCQRHSTRVMFLLLLLHLMATTEDSNVINRGGISAWQNVKKQAADLLNLFAADNSVEELEKLLIFFDQKLIQDNLSPGGAADLLALSFFFARLEGLV